MKSSCVLLVFLLAACQITPPLPVPPPTHPASPAVPEAPAVWSSATLGIVPPAGIADAAKPVGSGTEKGDVPALKTGQPDPSPAASPKGAGGSP